VSQLCIRGQATRHSGGSVQFKKPAHRRARIAATAFAPAWLWVFTYPACRACASGLRRDDGIAKWRGERKVPPKRGRWSCCCARCRAGYAAILRRLHCRFPQW